MGGLCKPDLSNCESVYCQNLSLTLSAQVWRHPGNPLNDPSWGRFEEYASFVCEITLFPLYGATWSGLWAELHPLLMGNPILPSLSSVKLRDHPDRSPQYDPCFLQLLSPFLRELTLDFTLTMDTLFPVGLRNRPDDAVQRIFSSIPDTAPGIEKITTTIRPSYFAASTLQSGYLHVRDVTVSSAVTNADLQLLAQLSALQRLCISLEGPSSVDISLTSLRTLALRGTVTDIAPFLTRTRMPKLASLLLSVSSLGRHRMIGTSSDITELLLQPVLAITSHHNALERLRVVYVPYYPPDPSRSSPLEFTLKDVFWPLLALSSLRSVYFDFTGLAPSRCTPAILHAIAQAWPNLEKYELVTPGRQREDDAENQCRLDSLVDFARSCPRLRVLRLPDILITQEALDEIERSPLRPAQSLEELVVDRVAVGDNEAQPSVLVPRITGVLRRLFPIMCTPVFKKDVSTRWSQGLVLNAAHTGSI